MVVKVSTPLLGEGFLCTRKALWWMLRNTASSMLRLEHHSHAHSAAPDHHGCSKGGPHPFRYHQDFSQDCLGCWVSSFICLFGLKNVSQTFQQLLDGVHLMCPFCEALKDEAAEHAVEWMARAKEFIDTK